MLKRISFSFVISSFFGLLVYTLIELIGGVIFDLEGFSAMTPEYRAMFPSETLALGVAVLLHGVIGAAFAGASFIYEKPEIGFLLQNILYFLLTGLVWIPVVSFVWQIYRYPQAFVCTISGFVITYVIMSVVGYHTTKKEVELINAHLAEEKEDDYENPGII